MPSPRLLHNRATTSIPLFLAPAFADTSVASYATVRSFSSTTCNHARRNGKKDMNKNRGVSAIRSTGPRGKLSVDKLFPKLPIPKPEEEREKDLEDFPTNPNHGLYGFFNKSKNTVLPPEEEDDHGREWLYHDLVFKDFGELHAIYWKGILEMNQIRTRMVEHSRLKLGYGAVEAKDRKKVVGRTLNHVRSVLKHRFSAYQEAKLLMEQKTVKELLETPESVQMKEPELEDEGPVYDKPNDLESSLSEPRHPGRRPVGPRPTN